MSELKLLPCPFCGGTDAFVERLDYSAAYVQCDSRIDEHSACLARGPVGVQDDDDEEIPGAAAAIRAWNEQAACRAAPVVGDDGLPPPVAAFAPNGRAVKWHQSYQASEGFTPLYTAEQVRQAQRDAIAADRTARAQQQAQSIDTPEFRKLLGVVVFAPHHEPATQALIAHINAWGRAGRTAEAPCRNCLGFGWEPSISGERRPCAFCQDAAPSPQQGKEGA